MSTAAIFVLVFSILAVFAALCVMAVLVLQNYNLRTDNDQLMRHNKKLAEYIRTKDSDSWERTPVRTRDFSTSTAVRGPEHKPARHAAKDDGESSGGISTGAIVPAMYSAGVVRVDATPAETPDEPREQQPETDFFGDPIGSQGNQMIAVPSQRVSEDTKSFTLVPVTRGRITMLVPSA